VKLEVDAGAEKCAEALASAAAKFLANGAWRVGARRASTREFSAKIGAYAAIGIADWRDAGFPIHRCLRLNRSIAERSVKAGRLLRGDTKVHIGLKRERRRFGVVRTARAQAIVGALEFVERVGAEVSKFLANFFGERAEVG